MTLPLDLIEDYRCRIGLTQQEMAFLIGIERVTYQAIVIQRRVKKPHGPTLYRFRRFIEEHREELGLTAEVETC